MSDDNKERQKDLQLFVAQGWTTLAIVMVGTGFIKFVSAFSSGDPLSYTRNHNASMLEVIAAVFGTFAIMTLVTRMIDKIWFRWLNVVLLFVAGAVMSLHMVHKMGENIMHGTSGVGNYIYQVVALITFIQAIRWARSAATPRHK